MREIKRQIYQQKNCARNLKPPNADSENHMKLNFLKVIRNLFKNPRDYSDFGLNQLNSGNYNLAILNFSKAIEIDKKFYEAYAWRGMAYYETEQFNLAKQDFTKVTELTPLFYNLNPFFHRANCKMKLKDFYGAIEDFGNAINYGSFGNKFDIYLNRGIVYFEIENYIKSIEDFDNAIKLGLNSIYKKYQYDKISFANAFYCRGEAKKEIEDLNGAILDFSEAIKYNPEDKIAYSERRDLYLRIGELNLAELDSGIIDSIEND
jgi:tetratricopeptide (TPR) repeat protein